MAKAAKSVGQTRVAYEEEGIATSGPTESAVEADILRDLRDQDLEVLLGRRGKLLRAIAALDFGFHCLQKRYSIFVGSESCWEISVPRVRSGGQYGQAFRYRDPRISLHGRVWFCCDCQGLQ
jgi:hypothetical protein